VGASLIKLHRPSARYYAGDLVSGREDHGVEPDLAARWWTGRAARDFGLAGAPDEGRLTFVLSGRSPDGQEVLGERPRLIGAFDLVLSAPKSVSVLGALAPSEQAAAVERAHELAVGAAVGFLERNLARVRERRSGDDRLEPAQTVGAVFCHRTSRALDPHLHAHVVLANAGQDPTGRWRSLDARPLFAEARTVGALYQAELRARLREGLGVRFGQRAHGGSTPQVVGVEEALQVRFSKRGAEVERQLADWGVEGDRASPRLRHLAALATRSPKEREWQLDELREHWAHEAGPSGRDSVALVFERGQDRLARTFGRRTLIPEADGAFGLLAEEVLRAELARGWAPTTFDLQRAWCSSLVDGATVAEVETATSALTTGRLGERLGLVALEAGWEPSRSWRGRHGASVPVVAPAHHWARADDARELQSLVDTAERLARRGQSRLDERAAQAALARALAERLTLRPELLPAAERALWGRGDVVALGVPDRDQDELAGAIGDAWRSKGGAVVVVSPGSRALDEAPVRSPEQEARVLVVVTGADRSAPPVLANAARLAEETGGRAVLLGSRRDWAPRALARAARVADPEPAEERDHERGVGTLSGGRARTTELPSLLRRARDRRRAREAVDGGAERSLGSDRPGSDRPGSDRPGSDRMVSNGRGMSRRAPSLGRW